ncbi:YraN family protein [bacterium]|nr:YraN family protein [bacterium]NCQ55200.1 YraN family protein [Candidatus Parcubacteria bacterium]NCS67287.1 YraN family protein [Candidatus Peregrinibacteria bacterium]NCS96542.1 YraN family protein [bacterium]
MSKSKLLGAEGEDYAAYYLKLKGKEIIARNVHASGGELDIIAYDKSSDVFLLIEVKTRSDESFAQGVEAVGRSKQKKMEKAAAHFFLHILRWPQMPVYEIHALVLTAGIGNGEFNVQYYDDLS